MPVIVSLRYILLKQDQADGINKEHLVTWHETSFLSAMLVTSCAKTSIWNASASECHQPLEYMYSWCSWILLSL